MRALLIALLLLIGNVEAHANPIIIEKVEQEFVHCGTLDCLKNQFVYVKVDDDYIHKLQPLIKDQGFEEPPYFGHEDLVGAHISVIYSDEMKEYGIIDIEEACTPISFKIKGCKIVYSETWKDVDSVFIIEVEAPELDCIRAKYGLPKRKYEYHITIGVKYRDAIAA